MLNEASISFAAFDILSDEEVRQGLKQYSSWPTYPQLYVHGSLIGGVDIVAEMKAEGDLKEQLELKTDDGDDGASEEESLDSRLSKLITRSTTMLFMKGAGARPSARFRTARANR